MPSEDLDWIDGDDRDLTADRGDPGRYDATVVITADGTVVLLDGYGAAPRANGGTTNYYCRGYESFWKPDLGGEGG